MSLVTEDVKVNSVESYPSILEAFPTGVVLCDSNGKIIQCNSELLRLFGYDWDELKDKPIETLLPTEYRGNHHSFFQNYLQHAQRRNMGMGRELFGQRKDSSKFPIEIGLNPIESDEGRQVIATVADISPRQRLQRNFQNIIEAAPVGMLIVEPDGLIRLANKYIQKIFGYTQEELSGQNIEFLIPQRHQHRHIHYRRGYVESPEIRAMGAERDLTGQHKNGSEIPVEIGLNPIETDEGTAIIATVIDITERKKAELQLKQVNTDLDEFTYVASHDLRSPLRGISNLVEWIEEDLGDEIPGEVKHNLNRINIRISRMEKLIDDLLTYARAGSNHNDAEPIILDEMLNELVQLIDLPEGFNIEVSGYTGKIYSPRTPLETVLRNLIGNAIKHHDKDSGLIRVDIKLDDAYCIFEVIDDGPGIPPAAHERVFKLFQALSLNAEGSRSGIGLAVSKRLIESHSGRIEIDSPRDNRGTCFRFWWPRFPRRDLNE